MKIIHRYWHIWPWAIIGIGALLRVLDLTTSPLWYDEAYSHIMAGLPLARLMDATAADVHPPLYYLILHALALVMGNTPLVLRGFSVVCSVAGLALYWPLARELGLNRVEQLLSMALLAIWPVNVYYAQEARMYAWLQLLVVGQLYTLYRRNWFALALITLLAIYSHNYGLIYTAFIGLIGLARYRKNRADLARLVCSIAIPGVAWLPWLRVLLGQMNGIYDSYWIETITPGSVVYSIYQVLAGFNVPDALMPLSVLCLGAGLVILVVIGIQQHQGALLAMAGGPLIVAVAASLAWRPMLLFRGLTPSLIALAPLAGIALARSGVRGRLIGMALLLPMLITVGAQIDANHTGRMKGVPIWYPVAGVPMVHLEDSTMVLSLSQYPDTSAYLMDADCHDQPGALSPGTRAALGYQFVGHEDLPDDFYFAAMVTPLATRCHEDLFNQITAVADPVYVEYGDLGVWGVWHAVR